MEKKSAQLIDGNAISREILNDLKTKIGKLKRHPGLAAILIGDDPASKRYIAKKKEACRKVGINFHSYLCGGDFYPKITEEEILKMIDWLNQDQDVNAIIIQLPIPKKFNTQKIINELDPKKDVDGFHPKNLSQAAKNSPLIKAVDMALKHTGEKLTGQKAVIVSKNPIFAKPLAQNLKGLGLEVITVEPTGQWTTAAKTADVLISIVGQPGLIKKINGQTKCHRD